MKTNSLTARAILVTMYSRKGCGLCEAAADKLDRMGLAYTVLDMELLISADGDWRSRVEHSAWWDLLDRPLPMIILRVSSGNGEATEKAYSYPQAMRALKQLRPVRPVGASGG